MKLNNMFKPLDYKAHAFSKYQGRETAMRIFDTGNNSVCDTQRRGSNANRTLYQPHQSQLPLVHW